MYQRQEEYHLTTFPKNLGSGFSSHYLLIALKSSFWQTALLWSQHAQLTHVKIMPFFAIKIQSD